MLARHSGPFFSGLLATSRRDLTRHVRAPQHTPFFAFASGLSPMRIFSVSPAPRRIRFSFRSRASSSRSTVVKVGFRGTSRAVRVGKSHADCASAMLRHQRTQGSGFTGSGSGFRGSEFDPRTLTRCGFSAGALRRQRRVPPLAVPCSCPRRYRRSRSSHGLFRSPARRRLGAAVEMGTVVAWNLWSRVLGFRRRWAVTQVRRFGRRRRSSLRYMRG